MPFLSLFTVHNLKIDIGSLPVIYLITGLCTIATGPMIGKLSDTLGKMRMFLIGCAISIITVLIYTHLGPQPLRTVTVVNVLLFVGVFSRMIPLQAIVSSVPDVTRRGAFNAINSAVQQLAGGLASIVAGRIVSIGADGKLLNIPEVGYIVVGTTMIAAVLAWRIQQSLKKYRMPTDAEALAA